MHTLCIASGVKYFDDLRGAWVEWWLFPATVSDDVALSVTDDPGYAGPGQVFADRPHVRRQGARVLVTQRGGYDV